MGDVVSLGLFRDRRDVKAATISGTMEPERMNREELHNHLRTAHKWGGPKSATKTRMLSAHSNSHESPVGFENPHSHGGA